MIKFTIPTLRASGKTGDAVVGRDDKREGRVFINCSQGMSLDTVGAIELATALADVVADIRADHAT